MHIVGQTALRIAVQSAPKGRKLNNQRIPDLYLPRRFLCHFRRDQCQSTGKSYGGSHIFRSCATVPLLCTAIEQRKKSFAPPHIQKTYTFRPIKLMG